MWSQEDDGWITGGSRNLFRGPNQALQLKVEGDARVKGAKFLKIKGETRIQSKKCLRVSDESQTPGQKKIEKVCGIGSLRLSQENFGKIKLETIQLGAYLKQKVLIK